MLIGVGIRQGGSPLLRLSGAIAAAQNASTEASCLLTPGGRRSLAMGEGRLASVSDRAGLPYGERPPTCWFLPQKSGAVAARGGRFGGAGTISSANLAAGMNLEATLDGSGTISNADLALILSAVATLTGSGTISAAVVGKLEAAATLSGSGDVTAALGALADIVMTLTGAGSMTALATAIGNVGAEITPFTELSPESLARAILDAADAIESGLTPRQALRIIAAATAGESSGGGTGTRVYRNAQADTKDRITATTDSNGNRTLVVLDTTDD